MKDRPQGSDDLPPDNGEAQAAIDAAQELLVGPTVPTMASTLVALFQTGRLQIAAGLELAPVLATELLSFKVKVNLQTGHDSYQSWRESVHDDLVLSVAMGCWYGEYQGAPAGVWLA